MEILDGAIGPASIWLIILIISILKTMIWYNILFGSILILITIFIHSIATRYIVYRLYKRNSRFRYTKEFWVALIVLILLISTIAEASIWAISYVVIQAIPVFEQSLYFSIVTFTTLGYGDIVLSETWRLLASFEAAIGIIIFGWTTAIVMAAVQKLFFKK